MQLVGKIRRVRAAYSAGLGTAGSGVALIAAERLRQITGEGWTPEHDDTHTRGQLAKAAGVYAMPFNGSWKAQLWPWEPETLKFTHQGDHNRVRELVKAGALIAAEIDRLNRLPFRPGKTRKDHRATRR